MRLVSTPWPPFTNAAGKPRFALDLVETALGRVGLKAETTIVEPAQFTAALMSDRYDGSAAAWKDAGRERVLVFSQPYLENRLVLVGRRGDDVSATGLGARQRQADRARRGVLVRRRDCHVGRRPVPSRSEEDSVALLLAKKVDYVLMDELVVQYILESIRPRRRRG